MVRRVTRRAEKESDALDMNTIVQLVREFATLKDRISTLTKLQSDLKKDLSVAVEEHGVEDDKGHIRLELPEEISGIGTLVRQRRVVQGFDDELAEFYPGSRHKRRPVEAKPKPERRALAGAWDDRPYRKVIGGVEREFFAIGALGKALDRPLVTLRLWIRQGHLPQATYRLPTKQVPVFDADGTQIETREQKGRRPHRHAARTARCRPDRVVRAPHLRPRDRRRLARA
jgi:hypothetical protein